MNIISNTTPLINFAVIDSFDFLRRLFNNIIIPEAVYREIVLDGNGRPGAHEVAGAAWIVRQTINDQRAVEELMNTTSLKAGESEAIILAIEVKADYVILDDLAARRYALAHHLPVIGTVGILLLAKTQKLIPAIRQPMDNLIAAGKYIHSQVYAEALRRAGE